MYQEGIGSLAQRAQYQIEQYQKSLCDPNNKQQPIISKSDLAYYYTHGFSDYGHLLTLVCSLMSRMVCGTIEEYLTGAFALQVD